MDKLNSKERILEAALNLFADIGYDATRVDEIALQANVKKPLIYYYFNSKQEILEELIDGYLKTIVNEKEQYLLTMESIDVNALYSRFDERAELFIRNQKYLRIIALEILKSSDVAKSILRRLKPVLATAMPIFNDLGLEVKNLNRIAIAYFFFGMTPTLMLNLFGDKFCEIYDIDRGLLDEEYSYLFKRFYIKSVSEMLTDKE